MEERRLQIAVIGAAVCDPALAALARDVGSLLAQDGAVLLSGGRGGVMAAAGAGSRAAGGLTVGVLPGADAEASPPNPHLDVTLYSGLGQARNQILVLSAGAVIAIGGGWGTLSEIAMALKHGVPVVCLESWDLSRPDGQPESCLHRAATAEAAVALALRLAHS